VLKYTFSREIQK